MTEWERFPNAPIVEALLDIRVKLPATVTLDQLARFQDGVRDAYPNRRTHFSWQAGFQMKPGGVSLELNAPTGGEDGYVFSSADGRQTAQARRDGFTFNRLKPYDRWESLRDEARRLWNRYREIANPIQIGRAALRYINRIEIPISITNFKEYVLTTPEIAPELPQGMSTFFMRLVIPEQDLGFMAIVTETMEEPKGDLLPFILDVDVHKERDFDASDDTVLWNTFERLRDFKNDIFFKSITPRSKELFREPPGR